MAATKKVAKKTAPRSSTGEPISAEERRRARVDLEDLASGGVTDEAVLGYARDELALARIHPLDRLGNDERALVLPDYCPCCLRAGMTKTRERRRGHKATRHDLAHTADVMLSWLNTTAWDLRAHPDAVTAADRAQFERTLAAWLEEKTGLAHDVKLVLTPLVQAGARIAHARTLLSAARHDAVRERIAKSRDRFVRALWRELHHRWQLLGGKAIDWNAAHEELRTVAELLAVEGAPWVNTFRSVEKRFGIPVREASQLRNLAAEIRSELGGARLNLAPRKPA